MATAEVRRFWTHIAAVDCVICRQAAEIAHAHGGSMIDIGIYRAKGQKPSDWLVLPLCPRHHRAELGGLDAGPRKWEAKFGTQLRWLKWVAAQTGIDPIEMMLLRNRVPPPERAVEAWRALEITDIRVH